MADNLAATITRLSGGGPNTRTCGLEEMMQGPVACPGNGAAPGHRLRPDRLDRGGHRCARHRTGPQSPPQIDERQTDMRLKNSRRSGSGISPGPQRYRRGALLLRPERGVSRPVPPRNSAGTKWCLDMLTAVQIFSTNEGYSSVLNRCRRPVIAPGSNGPTRELSLRATPLLD